MMKDFFISYNGQDKKWAEWIAAALEDAGYTTVIQAWDFRPGENFVLAMQKATTGTHKTIAVLSQNYLNAAFTHPEWADAFRRDPQGNERTLIPVRIDNCQPDGILASIIYADLYGLPEDDARQTLLNALADRAKPDGPTPFPGGAATDQPAPSSPTTQSPSMQSPTAPSQSNTSTPPSVGTSATDSASAAGSSIGGDSITTGNIEDSTGIAIGRDITQHITIINNPPAESAPFPGPETSSSTGSAALDIWREKLDFLRQQEAIVSDAAQKFALKKQIEEAEVKIRALS